jgi:hypothetical protein
MSSRWNLARIEQNLARIEQLAELMYVCMVTLRQVYQLHINSILVGRSHDLASDYVPQFILRNGEQRTTDDAVDQVPFGVLLGVVHEACVLYRDARPLQCGVERVQDDGAGTRGSRRY